VATVAASVCFQKDVGEVGLGSIGNYEAEIIWLSAACYR
jgi:hypothetical protein